jgi:hypothetical protein
MMRQGGLGLAVWILSAAALWARPPAESPRGAPGLAALIGGYEQQRSDSADSPVIPSPIDGDSEFVSGRDTAIVSGTRIATPPAPESWPNPTVTLLKSMAVPGWGQITNHRYIKAAVAIGLETWFIAGAVTEWRRADDALALFRADPADLNHYYDYDFHNGNKNDYLWALGVTVFISMFDAYVDAHLRPYANDHIPDVKPPPGVALVVASF